jgi:CubicO group peptidase (beta-lactamase class C family)
MLGRPPGERGRFAYSNQGYALAGRMCEVAAAKPWETLVRERIAAPLGMASVGFGVPSATGPAPKGHAEDGSVRDIDNPSAIGPAGTMHASVEDWARFVALHLRGDGLGLDAKDFESLHRGSPDEHAYAMGWRCATRPWGGAVLTHAGSNTLWFCVTWLAPEKGFAVLVACNQGGDEAQKACDDAASALIELHRAASR